ncbi:hypothetical protein [Streptomyces caatingaensis]|uniref:hypothetical protein n=1 Tax=Streptomyces caatingaensis TaxID=1678637 RepID=UPI0012FEF616|nr:hypothetical protein [Streptomyces caatingaensis]
MKRVKRAGGSAVDVLVPSEGSPGDRRELLDRGLVPLASLLAAILDLGGKRASGQSR